MKPDIQIVYVSCGFGNVFSADFTQEYWIEDEEIVLGSTSCDGIRVAENITMKHFFPFTAKGGPELALSDAIGQAAQQEWSGRLKDACQKDAEEKQLLRVESNLLRRG